MAPPPRLTLRDIRLTFGGTAVFEGADLQVSAGDRIGLVGRNGSGKSTLLRIAAAIIEPDSGERFVQPGTNISYLVQEPDLTAFATTRAYVEAAFDDNEDPYRAGLLLNELGLTGDEKPGEISGGQARRAALAAALAPEPDVLLLDEPTNHLDLPTIEWLEREIKSSRAAIVLISHDRAFLTALTRKTVWIDRGKSRELAKGFGAFEAWRDEVIEREELERHKLDRKIAREEQWMHGGVTARRKRNVRRVAELATLRQTRKDARIAPGKVNLEASEGALSGKLVIETKNIAKAYGDKTLINDFNIRIARGDRVAIAGPNGTGKTTLLKILTGDLKPDSGSVRHGANLEIVTLEQTRDSLDPETSLTDTLTGGRGDTVTVNGRPRHVASYLKDFLFLPEQARSPVSALSGGERARLMLARALAQPANLIVLDEPTNDLDLETLDLLQELIADYPGTVILVSHDRDFLDRTATSLITLGEQPGEWIEYAGGYSDMLAQRAGSGKTSTSVDAKSPTAKPKRNTPKKAGQDAGSKRQKLSFKDKHALETLPGQIDKLTAEIATLAERLAEPDLFTRDPDGFAETTERLAKLESDKSLAEERWLELEMQREELES